MYREHEPLTDDELHVLQGLLVRFRRHHAADSKAWDRLAAAQTDLDLEVDRRIVSELQDVS